MQHSRTAFEQVPVAVAKKIAKEEAARNRPANATWLSAAAEGDPEPQPSDMGAASDLAYPDWQEPVRQALVETDKEKLKKRLAAAEAVIFNRQQALSRTTGHQAELHAIDDALAILRVLKRENLAFPDWDEK